MTMNADDVLDAYISDVALRLPRKQRNDVAFELRALLREELQARAEAAGRGADAAMAMELVNAFGRPSEVAARYRPPLTIIDPADGHLFLRATVIGLAIIWGAGLLKELRQPFASGSDVLLALGRWWVATVVASLWWPGLLAVGFGAAAWARRRWPHAPEWKPRDPDRVAGSRASQVLAIIGILGGVFLISNPAWVLDFFWGGRAAPAAYEALTYTDAFLRRQAPWLFGLLLLHVPMLVTVFIRGRWSALLRRLDHGLSLLTCAVMAWTALSGPVFMAPASDRVMKLVLFLSIALTVVSYGVKRLRTVRPAPN